MFIKDVTTHPNPLVRALALRTMGCIRVDRIVGHLCVPLRLGLCDRDPYVRKTAAICVAKFYDLSPNSSLNTNLFPLCAVCSVIQIRWSGEDHFRIETLETDHCARRMQRMGTCFSFSTRSADSKRSRAPNRSIFQSIDIELVRRSVRGIGNIAVRLPTMAHSCVAALSRLAVGSFVGIAVSTNNTSIAPTLLSTDSPTVFQSYDQNTSTTPTSSTQDPTVTPST